MAVRKRAFLAAGRLFVELHSENAGRKMDDRAVVDHQQWHCSLFVNDKILPPLVLPQVGRLRPGGLEMKPNTANN